MNNLNKLYISKNLEYSSNIRKEILDVIPKFSKRILDLGCGNGSTCKWLKENNYCETTYGIEKFNINQIEIKQNIDFFCEANLETDDFFPNVKFDLILVLDVIEHLSNPWEFIKKIKNKLDKNGKIIFIIPNVLHYSVLKMLILNKDWKYQDSGIMDKTHLRFFTRKSIINLFTENDLRIEDLKFFPINQMSKSRNLNKITLGIFKEFLTTQYIIRTS